MGSEQLKIFVTPQIDCVFRMLRENEIFLYLAIENTG